MLDYPDNYNSYLVKDEWSNKRWVVGREFEVASLSSPFGRNTLGARWARHEPCHDVEARASIAMCPV